MDALHAALVLRRRRTCRSSCAARAPTSTTRQGKRYLDGLAGLFVSPARARAHRARRRRGRAGQGAGLPPAVVLRAPERDPARRADRRLRARRPQPGLLHQRRRRGRRDRVEAGQELLQAHRQADEAQGDQPARSPTTAPPRARCRSPGCRRSSSSSSRWCPRRSGCRTPTSTGRPIHGADDPEAFGRWAADQIAVAIENEGPDTVAAVFLEPVQNAGGCFPPPPGYFQRVREICDEYDVLLVSDEVICAFGRLGHMFGAERYGYQPDMITCAKGITSGYAPLGAMIATDRLMEPFLDDGAMFAHGYTFGGHPVSTAVALANLDDLRGGEGPRERPRQRGRLPRHPRAAAGPADRRRRPRRRVLLRDRAGQGQGHPGDVHRRGVRAAPVRLRLQAAVRRGPLLPRRRPRRPGRPALSPADLRPGALRRDGADPPRRPRQGRHAALTVRAGGSDGDRHRYRRAGRGSVIRPRRCAHGAPELAVDDVTCHAPADRVRSAWRCGDAW